MVEAQAKTEAKSEAKTEKPRPKGPIGWDAQGTGRRKRSVARVLLRKNREGAGKIVINEREIGAYFPIRRHQEAVLGPLRKTKLLGKYDVRVSVAGGGPSGQSGAVMHGVARALASQDEQLVPLLREDGYLTRDAREVERKKYGRSGARKRYQFSKR